MADTVTVHAHLSLNGARPDLSVSVTLPALDVRARAAELGAESLRAAAHGAASGQREVARCRTFTDQIRSVERRVVDAEKTFARPRA